MNRAGKFPTSLSGGDDIMGKITEIRSTIKITEIVEMSPEDLKYFGICCCSFSHSPPFQAEHHAGHQLLGVIAQEELAEPEIRDH